MKCVKQDHDGKASNKKILTKFDYETIMDVCLKHKELDKKEFLEYLKSGQDRGKGSKSKLEPMPFILQIPGVLYQMKKHCVMICSGGAGTADVGTADVEVGVGISESEPQVFN